MSETKRTADDDARALRRAKALELRVKAKMTMREIAKELNVSVQTAFNDVRVSIEQELEGQEKLIETARAVEDRRLDEWLAKVMTRLDAEEDPDKLAKLLAIALKTSERRSKLLGLDAPVKSEVDATIREGEANPAEAARLIRQKFGEYAVNDETGNTEPGSDGDISPATEE